MKNDKLLLTGSPAKKLLLFTLPILGAGLLQAMYGTVDLLVVGRFSDSAAVSAVSTGSMTMQTISGIITGLTTGCTILLGQRIGAGDEKAATRTIASSFFLFILLGIAATVAIQLCAGSIAGIMNAPSEAFGATVSYIKICGGGIFFIMLFNAFGGLFRGLGNSKTPLLLMFVACFVNIAGDLILTGIFDMGSDGTALATVAAQAVSVIVALIIVRFKGFGFKMSKKDFKPAKNETGHILLYGLPIAAQEALTGVSFMVILAILNGFGLVASAGVGVAEKICALMFLVPGSFLAAISAFTAQNVGAGRRDRAVKAVKTGMLTSLAAGLVMFAFSFFHGDILSSFFTSDAEVIAASADYLRSYSIDCVIVSINFCLMGYFNGNGKTAFVAAQGIASTFLVRIPVSYLVSRTAGVTLFEVGFATPLATVFAIAVDLIYLAVINKTEHKTKGAA